jgi:tetratricopeptide (TPR) repeat protein
MRRITLLIALGGLAVLVGCRDSGLDRGRTFLQVEDWPRAVSSYDQCVQNDPDNVEARLGLALARLGWARERAAVGIDSLEDWIRVARDMAIVERLDSTQNTRDDRADALFRACLWLQRRGRAAQAEHMARLAQQADPRHAPSAQFLGNMARARGNDADAERWFSHALSDDSTYLPAYISLGELALADKDPEGAIVYWQLGQRRDPGNAWLRDHLQAVRDSLGWGTSR